MTAWQALVASPLFGVVLTLGAYQLGRWLQRRLDGHAVVQPVLVAVVVGGATLLLLDVDYADYYDGASLIAFLLGPATVALAIPLHREMARVRRALVPILGGVVVGAVVSVTTAVGWARLLGADESVVRSLALKATTTPVAIVLAEQIGGVAALAAVFAVSAGILGAVAAPAVLNLLRVRDARARGLAIGAVSHGIGTSRALRESQTEGAFSGLAMGLTALATSLMMPLLTRVLGL